MSEPESKLRQRCGGRLDRSRDPAILNAALATLTENGYDATNMDDVAARAGVGKAAIYRRWSSKAALITVTLSTLERQGLVIRVDDPEDGRVSLVGLSDEGRALRGEQQRERRDRLAVLLSALPAEDQAALNLAMRAALPIVRRLIDQAHRSRISTVDCALGAPART
jgi:AcrR family transcriptional regulator